MKDAVAPVALVTGAATPVGTAVARRLHAAGYEVLLHFNTAQEGALALAIALNTERNQSAHCLRADLLEREQLDRLARDAVAYRGRLDLLVNHATGFLPVSLEESSEQDWNRLTGRNLKAQWFLAQRLASALRDSGGCLINLGDAEGGGQHAQHALYAFTQSALDGMTRVLARELAPRVRVLGLVVAEAVGQVALTPEAVADTVLALAAGRLAHSGEVYHLRQPCPPKPAPEGETLQGRPLH